MAAVESLYAERRSLWLDRPISSRGRLRVAILTAAVVGAFAVVPAQSASAVTVKVYFLRGEQFAAVSRPLPAGQRAEVVAVRALLAGPSAAERRAGIDTTIPHGAGLRSIAVKAGVASVDFSFPANYKATRLDVSLRPARAAQVIYTLTALSTIRHFVIKLNGRIRASFEGADLVLKGPLDRADFAQPLKLPPAPKLLPTGPAPLNL